MLELVWVSVAYLSKPPTKTELEEVRGNMSKRKYIKMSQNCVNEVGIHVIFKNLSISFNWRLITWQYCSDFCHTLTWISHGCTCVPHPIPLGHPSAPELSALSHALNLDWWSISHMIINMFQYYFSNHPTLAISHRVQKSVLYICVSFAVSHIGSSLPSF